MRRQRLVRQVRTKATAGCCLRRGKPQRQSLERAPLYGAVPGEVLHCGRVTLLLVLKWAEPNQSIFVLVVYDWLTGVSLNKFRNSFLCTRSFSGV